MALFILGGQKRTNAEDIPLGKTIGGIDPECFRDPKPPLKHRRWFPGVHHLEKGSRWPGFTGCSAQLESSKFP